MGRPICEMPTYGPIVMSTPLFAGSAEPWGSGGFTSPDPVTTANPSWTWDLEFDPVAGSLYARSTLNSFAIIGGGSGWCGGGIVEYRTRNQDGSDTVHSVGQSADDGYVDLIWDNNVDSVTFGWILEGDNYCDGRLNMEIWV